jgi:PBSX family phage terminase large subunit
MAQETKNNSTVYGGQTILSPKQQAAIVDWTNKDVREICYDGGARSGKTYYTIVAILNRALAFPNSRHLVARYRLNHMTLTVWMQTLMPILKANLPDNAYEIDNQLKILTLFNGSVIMGAGLDDKDRVEKIMGSEYCTIFINEATQISYETYQKLKTRLSMVAFDDEGNPIKRKIILDCNPRSEHHWIYKYFISNKDPVTKQPHNEITIRQKTRRNWNPYDNPFLPKDYLEILESLTGTERQRLLEGLWVNQEGLVYPDHEKIIVEPFKIPDDWEKIGSVDFGYTNPFVFLFFAFDKSNETFYLYDEIYQSEKTVRQHAIEIKKRNVLRFKKILADHDAEDRATLSEEGIVTLPANKDITTGIQSTTMMINADNGYKLRIFRTCVETLDEMAIYSWETPKEGKNPKEVPIKFHDHAMDALRYFCQDTVGANLQTRISKHDVRMATAPKTAEDVLRKRYENFGIDMNQIKNKFS